MKCLSYVAALKLNIIRRRCVSQLCCDFAMLFQSYLCVRNSFITCKSFNSLHGRFEIRSMRKNNIHIWKSSIVKFTAYICQIWCEKGEFIYLIHLLLGRWRDCLNLWKHLNAVSLPQISKLSPFHMCTVFKAHCILLNRHTTSSNLLKLEFTLGINEN